MKRLRSFTIVVLSVLWLVAAVSTLAENPKNIHPAGYVTDLAGVIAPETKARLEALCREVEEKTGAQIAVVTVHSLEGDSVENFAVNLYKQLGVGSKGDNRGVLLLVAPEEHKYRIEVGYGLEPVINDARAGDAGRAMVPFLRQGDYGNQERELDAPVLVPETVPCVNGQDDDGHRPDDGEAPDRAQEAGRDQQPADELGQRCRPGPATSRAEAHLTQHSGEPLDAAAPEPSEELLGTVRRHREADANSKD